jgi:hypothetical protein
MPPSNPNSDIEEDEDCCDTKAGFEEGSYAEGRRLLCSIQKGIQTPPE